VAFTPLRRVKELVLNTTWRPGFAAIVLAGWWLAGAVRAGNAVACRGSGGGLTHGATCSLGRGVVDAGSPAGTGCPGELSGATKAWRKWAAMTEVDNAP
jgi:hypothetical protein